MISIRWLIAFATMFAPFIYFFFKALAMLQAVAHVARPVIGN